MSEPGLVPSLSDIEERIEYLIGAAELLAVRPHRQTNLWDAGLDSLGAVSLMLAVEDEFDVEFSDEVLADDPFQTVSRLAQAVSRLVRPQSRR